jgi:low-affinity ferrous iron transport protein
VVLPYAALRHPDGPEEKPPSRGSRAFDAITHLAGTPVAFGGTVLGIGGWAVAGIPLKASDNWQIFMQIISSIQCYASATLLMRQQRNQAACVAPLLGAWQASNATKERLLPAVMETPSLLRNHPPADVLGPNKAPELGGPALPPHSWLDRTADRVSDFAGSPWALGGYSAGIGAWVATGPSQDWDDRWQLFVNTAVAVQLTFMTMFLQNTRRRHMNWVMRAHGAVEAADGRIEARLRAATGDVTSNPVIDTAPTRPGPGTRAIDAYSNLVASGVGAAISAGVFATWLAVGKPMRYSSNWWLIIGTYTGLMGFIDGFVLRNVHRRQAEHLQALGREVERGDLSVFHKLGLAPPAATPIPALGAWYGASSTLGKALARPEAVVGSLALVGGLLAVATFVFHWDVTGQLICNTPTMIGEGFMLHLLMLAHNEAHAERRRGLYDALVRRNALSDALDRLEATAA